LDLFFQIYKQLKFNVFQEDWTIKNWKFAIRTFADSCRDISDYVPSIFHNGVQGPMLNKTRQSFSVVTFEPWLKGCEWRPLIGNFFWHRMGITFNERPFVSNLKT